MGSQQWGNKGGSQKQPQALKWRVDGRDGRQRLDPFRLPIERSKLSEFVLVPVTAAARNSCRSLHRRGDGVAVPAASASATVATTTATTTPPPPPLWIPLLDGDNIVGTGVGHGLGLGIPVGTEGVDEKQVLLRTTNALRGSVLLKAFHNSVRVRRRASARASPAPASRRTRSPLTPRSPGSPRPTRSPRSPSSARKGHHTTSKRGSGIYSGGGGSGDGTSIVTGGAQLYLLVGETLELNASDSSQSSYCYTLEYASDAATTRTSETPPRAVSGSSKSGINQNGNDFWPACFHRLVDLTGGKSPGARVTPKTATLSSPPSSARGGVSPSDSGTATKRCLEGTFAVNDTVMMSRDTQSARSGGARGSREDARCRTSAAAATVVGASDRGARQERVRRSSSSPSDRSKKRQRDWGRTSTPPFYPPDVVDLCDVDDLPVVKEAPRDQPKGDSKDQPVDLCDSDDETVVDRSPAADVEGEACPVVIVSVISPPKRGIEAVDSSSPGRRGPATARGRAATTVSRPISFGGFELPPAAARTQSPEMPLAGGERGAGKDKDEDGRREDSLLSSLSCNPMGPGFLQSRPPHESQPAERRGGQEGPTQPIVRTPPPSATVVAAAAEVSRRAVSVKTVAAAAPAAVVPRRVASGKTAAVAEGAGKKEVVKKEAVKIEAVKKEAVKKEAVKKKASKKEEAISPPPMEKSRARPLPCSGDPFLRTLKPYIHDCPERTMVAIEETLACGARAPSNLCAVIMTELLKSRCKVRIECLRRQLRAVLSAYPFSSSSPSSCWRPPDNNPPDNAPAWLEGVMLGITPSDDRGGDSGSGGGSGIGSGVDGDNSSELPPASTIEGVLDAHVAVLEVVVDYLVSGGSPAERKCRLGELFGAEERAKGQKATQSARRAVESCTEWAVVAWSAAAVSPAASVRRRGLGSAGGSAMDVHSDPDPARAQVRLLTVRLLSGVVEACGLPVGEACTAIRDQMDAVGLPPGAAEKKADAGKCASASSKRGRRGGGSDSGVGGGAGTLPRRGLGAVACHALVRALCCRPFGAELAAVLSASLPATDGVEGDAEDVVRLRLLLSRVIQRAADNTGGRVLLSCSL